MHYFLVDLSLEASILEFHKLWSNSFKIYLQHFVYNWRWAIQQFISLSVTFTDKNRTDDGFYKFEFVSKGINETFY